MTPYLVNTTWVDLDHVLAVDNHVTYVRFEMIGLDDDVYGSVIIAFRDPPLRIALGQAQSGRDHPEAQAVWTRFIEAWKARAVAADPIDPLTGRRQSFYRQHILKP